MMPKQVYSGIAEWKSYYSNASWGGIIAILAGLLTRTS